MSCHYVIVRADLERGFQAAQIIHAAGESSPGSLSKGTYAIALSVPNEDALMEVAARLIRARVDFVPVFEPDAPHNGALTALGLVPRRKEELRRHLSSLPKLK